MMNGTTVQAISTVVLSWKLAARAPLRLAVLEDRIEHHAEHGEEDHQADDQHEVVQPLLSAAIGRDRRMQVELVHRRAAGEVVHRPRGERPCRAEDQGEPAERSAKRSNRHHLWCHVSRILRVVRRQAVGDVRRPAQRRAQLVGQGAAQLGAHEAADGDAPALARELDQRAVADARARPGPRPGGEIDLLGAPPEGAVDREPAGRSTMLSWSAGMAGVDERARRRRRAARRRRTAGRAGRRASRTAPPMPRRRRTGVR